mgnify:CR=1 FL=1
MTLLAYLIPIALFLGALGLGAFLWSLKSGQYDDLEGAAERILYDAAWRALADEDKPLPGRKSAPQDRMQHVAHADHADEARRAVK